MSSGHQRRGLAAVRRTAALLAVIVAAATAATAPGVTSAGAAGAAGMSWSRAQADGRIASAQAVADERVAAVAAGDEARWLTTVDPEAPAAFRDAQVRLFSGLRSLPLAEYRLTVRLDDTGDLAVRAGTFLPETRQRMRLAAYDSRAAVESHWWTYVARGGRWYVADDDELQPVGLYPLRGLWDFGEVQAVESEHFVVLAQPAQAARAREVASLAEEAMGVLRGRWERDWDERVPIVLPGSTEALAAMLQTTLDLSKFLAFVSYSVTRDEGWSTTAPRLYLNDANLVGYSRAGQIETLVHELVHAATALLSGPFVPTWIHEGLADWVATGRSPTEGRPGGSDRELPRDYEFTTGSQTTIVRAYRESRSAMSFFAAEHGPSAPADLFAEVGQIRVAPGSSDFHVAQAFQRTAGITLEDFQSAWARR